MLVQLIAKPDSGMTGTSRYTSGLYRGLQEAGVDVRLTFPDPPPVPAPMVRGLRRLGMDLRAFFSSYPLRAHLDNADVYHITTQTMATLLWFQRFPTPVVVTVLDIIPYLVRHDPELNTFRHPVDYLFYRLALAGLRRADVLIAISEYTKRTLVETLGLPPERVHVVYPAVDHERFGPMDVLEGFWMKYGLDKKARYILYVGSDDPRKNLRTLVRAFALIKQQVGNVKLLKVGAPHFVRERQRLRALVCELRLQQDVLFFDYVPDEDLPLFYNVADVFVLPSLYEGFGLPALEAMACGTPVVVANSASLPEVVGDAGCVVSLSNAEALARQLQKVLLESVYHSRLSQASEERARTFDLAQQAKETASVYFRVSGVR
jgi:glycosyltransferase involved in cell wall biosynthesis